MSRILQQETTTNEAGEDISEIIEEDEDFYNKNVNIVPVYRIK